MIFTFPTSRTRSIWIITPKSSIRDVSTIHRRVQHHQSSVHNNDVDTSARTFPCWFSTPIHFHSTPNACFATTNHLVSSEMFTVQQLYRRCFSSKTPPIDYQSLAVDRIVLDGDERVSPDSSQAEAEVNLQRLANECKHDPNGPNLLLNMLEMMDNEDIQVSPQTMLQTFKQVVQSSNVKLLQKTENLIVRKYRQDPNLLRLLIVAYLHANAPEQAQQLLVSWPHPAPAIQSYRLVLTALSKKGDHVKSFQLLQYLCQNLKKSSINLHPGFSSPTNTTTVSCLPTVDRECYHSALVACIKSNSDDAFLFAQRVMKLMVSMSAQDQQSNSRVDFVRLNDSAPNRATYRLFVKAWSMTRDAKERQLLHEKAFDWLRKMEKRSHAPRNVDMTASTGPQYSPDIQCYNVIMNVLAEDGKYREVKELFLRLLDDFLNGASHVQPDPVSIHTVLKAHSQAMTLESAEEAEEFLEWLQSFAGGHQNASGGGKGGEGATKRSGGLADSSDSESRTIELQLTARSYATLLALWVKLGMPDRALAVLEKAEENYRSSSQQNQNQRQFNNLYRPDVVCYQSVVNALYKVEPLSAEVALQAQDVVHKMVKLGYKPNLLTFNTVLSCWVKAGRPHDAELFLDQILKQDLHIQPDIVSYNTVIQGFCNSKQMDKAIEILKVMLDSSVISGSLSSARVPLPNVRTFTTILSCLAKQRTLHTARQAEELVFQMQDLHDSRNLDTMPTEFTYNVLLNCWASLSKIDPKRTSQYSRRVEEILADMKSLSDVQQPTVVSYNTVLKTYRNSIVKAEKLLDDLIAYGLKPNEKTWDAVMEVLKHDKSIDNKEEKRAQLRQKYFLHTKGLQSRNVVTTR
jgi:pentatricopeptide repeat protein